MDQLLINVLNGVSAGLLLFMLSSGMTLIFSMMGVLNFAHASFYMLGAYFAYTLSLYIGFWLALIAAPILCGLVGAAIERYGLRQVHKNGHVAELLGYSTQTSFTRWFRAEFGVAPMYWQKSKSLGPSVQR